MPGPQQIRQEQRRIEKLEDMRQQVEQGKLVIRQMTDEERAAHPPPKPDARRRSKRRA